jgi:hypothetical protein
MNMNPSSDTLVPHEDDDYWNYAFQTCRDAPKSTPTQLQLQAHTSQPQRTTSATPLAGKPRSSSTTTISRTVSAPLHTQPTKTVKRRGSKSAGASPATKKSSKKHPIPIADIDTYNYIHKQSKRPRACQQASSHDDEDRKSDNDDDDMKDDAVVRHGPATARYVTVDSFLAYRTKANRYSCDQRDCKHTRLDCKQLVAHQLNVHNIHLSNHSTGKQTEQLDTDREAAPKPKRPRLVREDKVAQAMN